MRIQDDEKYQQLLEEIKYATFETRKEEAFVRLKRYWSVGEIIEQYQKEIGHNKLLQRIARDADISNRTLENCLYIYRKWKAPTFDEALMKFPVKKGGLPKITQLLGATQKETQNCPHTEIKKICRNCRITVE